MKPLVAPTVSTEPGARRIQGVASGALAGAGTRFGRSLPPLVLTALVLAVWELALPFFRVSRFILARPSDILAALIDERALFASSIVVTSREIAIGFLASVAVGVAISLVLCLSDLLNRAVTPLVVVFQLVPKVALAPLLILWFGFGDLPKIVLIMFISFFPITLNMSAGLESVDRNLLLLMQSVGATRWQVMRHVQIPASLPYLFAGLRIAVTFSVIGAVVAEFAGANQGLGYLIQYESTQLDTPLIFAGLVAISIVGLAFYWGLVGIQRLVYHWYPQPEVKRTGT